MTVEQEKSVAANPGHGRTLGFTLLGAIIVFVAFWMAFINPPASDDSAAGIVLPLQISGFNSEAWYLPNTEQWGFVPIEAGGFTMGSNPTADRLAYDNERWSQNRRQGSVSLPLYYIGRYEVTVAQFAVFAKDTDYQLDDRILAAASDPNDATKPVTFISWPDALAYARWLEQKLRQSPDTPVAIRAFLQAGARVTLPSEAQWEKAARGSDGRIFPWGSRARTDLANFAAEAPVPVGSIKCAECAHGLADMSGNVWELTRSPYQPYPYNEDDDAQNLQDDSLWVMRGGAFSDPVNNVRSAVRGGVDPGVKNATIGFRLVISQ